MAICLYWKTVFTLVSFSGKGTPRGHKISDYFEVSYIFCEKMSVMIFYDITPYVHLESNIVFTLLLSLFPHL